jgi:hypothetical protein
MPAEVYVETGSKKVFVCAVGFPGWCRSGKDENAAMAALAAYAERYSPVAERAGARFARRPSFAVVERVAGSGATDFGVPDRVPALDHEPLTARQRRRLVRLLSAAWERFDEVVGAAPATLRKGPRGGGRDRDAIVEHVLGAEASYGRSIGLRLRQPDLADRAGIEANRVAILDVITAGVAADRKWPTGYAARRIAWHVLDHAWEIEDKGEPAPSS